jgi:hypothetical protein
MDPGNEPCLASLADRHYGKGSGGYDRKPQSFIAEYERLFSRIRHKRLRILELGVYAGQSLLIWRDYFPEAVIVGVDIRERPKLIAEEPRIHFVKGSQDDPKTLDAAAAMSGRAFDIIIDDASHVGYLTKRSLHYLFPRWLRPGGRYIIEDIGASFLDLLPDSAPFPENEPESGPQTRIFPSHQHGILGVIEQVMDQAMKGMATGTPSLLDVERITFLPNMAIIRKAPARAA